MDKRTRRGGEGGSMILHGDSKEVLKSLEADSIDALITDPPYAISFMNRAWDRALPSIEIWKECFRVLKPGAFAFVMSAPRSDVCSRMALLLEEAGFNISFTPIAWSFASGFPKAANVRKQLEKRGEAEGAKQFDGAYSGFQPKPSWEMVIVAMKPLSEKTYVDQALKNGKGITWLDDARIPVNLENEGNNAKRAGKEENYSGSSGSEMFGASKGNFKQVYSAYTEGRFPANLLVSDDVLNDGRVQKSGKAVRSNPERINNWMPGKEQPILEDRGYADSGSYSRYFDLDAWFAEKIKDLPESVQKTFPFLIVPKAAKSEKNAGLDGFPVKTKQSMGSYGDQSGVEQADGAHRVGNKGESSAANHHPTVKPLKLMSYIITLATRPGDTILEPFAGSGTTCVAAKMLGRECIGCERELEYVKIAQARVDAVPSKLF